MERTTSEDLAVLTQSVKEKKELLSSPHLIKVFVSSSFRDFSEERDLLSKLTFPRLRRLCNERDLVLVECDLRWGITAEQAERGQVVPICLTEVENCRPYFVCMLGERYGWVLDDFSEELKMTYPWIDNFKGRSITELEIRHAVLNPFQIEDEHKTDLQKKRIQTTISNSLFYFRDDTYSEKVPDHLKMDYISDSEISKVKMTNLKNEIKSLLPVQCTEYTSPNDVAEMIYQDLKKKIEADFPLLPKTDDSQQSQHENELANLTRIHIPNEEYHQVLTEFVENEIPSPLVVIGESGSGKSSLLAEFCRRNTSTNLKALIFYHFVGASSDSVDPSKTIFRILSYFKHKLKLSRQLPSVETDDLIKDFPSWLETISSTSSKPIIIIVDGIDKMDKAERESEALSWLPREYPKNIRLILSTTINSVTHKRIQEREWTNFLTINPLTFSEKEQILLKSLREYSKSLSEDQISLILNSPKTSNPSFLKCLIEELRVFGHFETLTQMIEANMNCENIIDLYIKMLNRMEVDYEETFSEHSYKGIIQKIMSTLWVSRTGLEETEILAMLKIPFAIWSPIYQTIQSTLSRNKEGRLYLYNPQMRAAVKERYLLNKDDEKISREKLIEYILSLSNQQRQIEEVPYQHYKNENWEQLYLFVREIEKVNHFNLFGYAEDFLTYWRKLEPHYDSIKCYTWTLADSNITSKFYKNMSIFYRALGKYKISQQFIEKYMKFTKKDEIDNAHSYTFLAWLEYKARNYEKAEQYHLKALEVFEKIPSKECRIEQAATLNSLGVLYKSLHQYEKAEATHLKGLELKRIELGEDHESVSWSLFNLGIVYRLQNRIDEAEKMLLDSLKTFIAAIGSVHINIASRYNALARLYLDKKDFEKAEEMLKKDLEIRTKILGPTHADLGYPLSGLGELYYKTQKYDLAEEYYLKTIEIQLSTLGENHQVVGESYYELALVYLGKQQKKKAIEFLEKAKKYPGSLTKANQIIEEMNL